MTMHETAPTGALIISFPQDRNIGKARHVAALLLKRATKKDRESYWRQVCNRMAASLARIGFDEAAICDQLELFRQAVSAEMTLQEGAGAQEGAMQ